MQTEPAVSVCVIAYNHAKYIRQCLDGIIEQQTDFPFEIVIHDDCSSDGTSEIIAEYQKRFPDLINAILQSENQYRKGRHILPITVEQSRGDYIAICEGDDYWNHDRKLQKQYEWMEINESSPFCFHNVIVRNETKGTTNGNLVPSGQSPMFSIDDVLQSNIIGTCSTFIRKDMMPKWTADLNVLKCGDWPRWILMLQHGEAGYLDGSWGCHRHHEGGTWSTLSESNKLKNSLQVLDQVTSHLDPKYSKILASTKKRYIAETIDNLFSRGYWKQTRRLVLRYLLSPPKRFRAPNRRLGLYLRIILGIPSGSFPRPSS